MIYAWVVTWRHVFHSVTSSTKLRRKLDPNFLLFAELKIPRKSQIGGIEHSNICILIPLIHAFIHPLIHPCNRLAIHPSMYPRKTCWSWLRWKENDSTGRFQCTEAASWTVKCEHVFIFWQNRSYRRTGRGAVTRGMEVTKEQGSRKIRASCANCLLNVHMCQFNNFASCHRHHRRRRHHHRHQHHDDVENDDITTSSSS